MEWWRAVVDGIVNVEQTVMRVLCEGIVSFETFQ